MDESAMIAERTAQRLAVDRHRLQPVPRAARRDVFDFFRTALVDGIVALQGARALIMDSVITCR